MHKLELAASEAMGRRVWHDLGQLAAEAVAIGILFSVLLGLGVFFMARDDHANAYGGAAAPEQTSPASRNVSPTA